jgi:3-oxoadipate CoA-transferase beta subunit
MDLVAGVKIINVISQHVTNKGYPKLVDKCTFPLTGVGVVKRIYTDLAVIDVTSLGFKIMELAPGVSFEYVQERTGCNLIAV